MAGVSELSITDWTVADLYAHFGPIPHGRIRQVPAPGAATEQDVLAIHDREKRLYELVDGVLVEKTMGVQESYLAVLLAGLLGDFAGRHDLGFVLGADGMARLAPGLVRIPDVSFVSWDRVPGRQIPRVPMLGFGPDLAVEVLSASNTREEMDRKLRDYSSANVRLVWNVDPAARTIQVFTAVDQSIILREGDILSAEPLLPGFRLPLRDLFNRLAQ